MATVPSSVHPAPEAACWQASTLADERSYTRQFGPADLNEVERAIRAVRSAGMRAEDIRSGGDFPLTWLRLKLVQLRAELEAGLGFALLRGLPVTRYDLEEQRILVMGLMAHLGVPMHQDTKGTLVEAVTDRGLSYEDRRVRGYMTRAELTPHCDSGDVVGLLCVRPARHGGTSQIASGASIYRELESTTPHLLDPLFRGFHHNIRGNGPPGAEDVTRHRVPVFCIRGDRLSIRFNLKAILTAEELPGVDPLTPIERQAVARVAELALDPDLRVEMALRAGDLQLLNNHMILHTRTAYEDHEDPAAKRLLFRVWVNLPNGRPLDVDFADHFNTGPRQPPALKV